MAPKTTTNTETTTSPAAPADKFTLLSINTSIPMPEKKGGKRGSKSTFPFDLLPVGGSFGLIGRDAKSMSSIVSSQNRKKENQANKVDAEGNTVFKTKPMKTADGTEIQVPTAEPVTYAVKEFFAVDTDPKTDPEGATVRVFRKL
jgi:hypothetical protein